MYESFASWAQLLDHVAGSYPLYYQAPMDHQPVLIAVKQRQDGCLRVYPPYRGCDPFTADERHLERFWRLADRRTA